MGQTRLTIASAMTACGTLIVCMPNAWAAERAATVEFSVGNAQVISVNGQSRRAVKGVTVDSGDTLDTGSGRVQLRFTDGAYVSLQPQTKFRIDDYRFEGKTDGSERGFFSLLSGGMRTITGLVGRTNKRSYQVSTSVATIGIRGTAYKISYTDSVIGSVGEGAINVCTGAGCVPFNSGESFIVPNAESRPQLTSKQVELPPPSPEDVPGGSFGDSNDSTSGSGGGLVSGNQVDAGGNPVQLVMTGPQSLGGLYAWFPSVMATVNYFPNNPVTLDANGVVTNFNGKIPAVYIDRGGNDGYTVWGAFKDTAGVITHFAAGLPPTGPTPMLATYTLQPGYATAVTDGTGTVLGTLVAWSQTVDFNQGSLLGSATWNVKGAALTATLGGSPDGPWYFSGSCPNNGCSVSGQGLPFGPNWNRFGLAYSLTAGGVNGMGAAVLTQSSAQGTTTSGGGVVAAMQRN